MKGPTMAIKCGSTGHSHETVAQVRACQLGGTLSAPVPATGGSVVMDRLQREIPEAVAEPIGKAIDEGRPSFQAARLFIEGFKDAQRKAPAPGAPVADAPALPDVPAGRYALRTDGIVKFYILDRPESGRWAGYVFLKAQASDEKYPIKNLTAKAEILGRISEGIEGAQKLYGQELGRCYACGRTLTDETSRALGIGPDCRSK